MADERTESQSNTSTYNVILSVLENNYSNTIHTVPVSNDMTFGDFKGLIKDLFDTTSFQISFAEMVALKSSDTCNDDKPLNFFLFKEGSTIKIYRYDIDYNLDESFVPQAPKLIRQIGTHKWITGHMDAYYLNKPVMIQTGFNHMHVITPNGKRYEGLTEEILEELCSDGYSVDSFATMDELRTVEPLYCYYTRG